MFWDLFNTLPIVAVLRGYTASQTRELGQICRQEGLVALEITMNSPEPEAQIASLRKAHDGEMLIGAGTVCSIDDLERALSAGAQFIITPVLVPEVITTCKQRGVPVFPGAYTPTEVFQAWKLGADIVKVFPASTLGPGFIKDLRGPFEELKLMPVGGIVPEIIGAYYQAGAAAFGVGGQLIEKELVEAEEWDKIGRRIREYTEAYNRARNYKPRVIRGFA